MGFDVICIGGATVDLFLLIDPQNPHIKFNKEENELYIHLGDKVVLEGSKLTVGGNANNLAVGIRRLGFRTALMAEIGNDEFAGEILDNLRAHGVPLTFIKKTQTVTSFSVVLNFEEDRTVFTRKVEREHDFNFRSFQTEWVYLTSLGNKWEKVYKRIEKIVRGRGPKLAFNPGPAQLDKGLSSFSSVLECSEILILNRQEGERILNSKDLTINDLLFGLKKFGPKIVVITDGENGSFAVNERGEIFEKGAIKVRVVSATGAGDAYSSGFMGAILSNRTLEEAMEWGTKNAASVIKLIGAQKGLLKLEEIKR